MTQPTQIVRLDGRRLVLGFDAGCMTCSKLAVRIKEQVGEKLEVLNLHDHRVEQWRKSALGEDAPWGPTLIEVKGLRVRAWTGWQMAVQLGRFLGPVATWRVMLVLGEVGAAPKIEESSIVEKLPERAAEKVVGMSRGQFLKGTAGAAVAMGLFSGFGPFTRRAEAVEEWQLPPFASVKKKKGRELRDYCDAVAKNADVEWVAGPDYVRAMQSGFSVSGADDEVAQTNGVTARASEYKTDNGNELYVCAFNLKNDKVVTFFRWEKMRNNVKTDVRQWAPTDGGNYWWVHKLAINGDRFIDPTKPTVQAAQTCPQNCQCLSCQQLLPCCATIDIACAVALSGCYLCRGLCVAPPFAECLVCLFGVCIGAVYLTCCAQTCTVCVSCAPSTT